MRMAETLIFYLLVGVVVAVAMYLAEERRGLGRVFYLAATSLCFWPLYLPLLLTAQKGSSKLDLPPEVLPDEMATAIEQVERELRTALSSLEGWPDAAMAREKSRVEELRAALSSQAKRIREIDELLAVSHPSDLLTQDTAPLPGGNAAAADRFQKSQQARQNNFSRLETIRRKSHADLMATLAWVRELVSMIHLAKFTGAPASRTEELVAQIEAAVEGISRVDWPDDSLPASENAHEQNRERVIAEV